MKLKLFGLPFLLVCFAAAAVAQPVINGNSVGDNYQQLAVQLVQTGFGDNTLTTTGSELDAAYGRIDVGNLSLLLTGNLEGNFNALEIFIDSKAGGENTLSGLPVGSAAAAMAGMTFDAGFTADYLVVVRNGILGTARFDLDFTQLGTASSSSYTDVFGGTLEGAGSTGNGVNAQPIQVAFDNSNVAGVGGNSGAAADQVAAAAVQTGVELRIALSDLGHSGQPIRICAFVNGSNHDFASNQFLGALAPPTNNLGSDGAGNFTASLSFDLNNFTGEQFFTVVQPVVLDVNGVRNVDNLRLIALALSNYESAFTRFPGEYIGSVGTPLLSWRVSLLPFLGYQSLYDQFDLTKPWDDPVNLPLLQQMPDVYRGPLDPPVSTNTRYVGGTGTNTMFDGPVGFRLSDVSDGTSNTIFVGETQGTAIPWTKPQDIVVGTNPTLGVGGFASFMAGAVPFAFVDGSVRFVPDGIDSPTLLGLFLRNDGLGDSGVTLGYVIPGDFNGDTSYDCDDVNLLTAEIVAGTNDLQFDLNSDALVSPPDLDAWLIVAGSVNLGPGLSYPVGDLNLDGSVDGQDLVGWLALGSPATAAGFCDGDFNADGMRDDTDLDLLCANAPPGLCVGVGGPEVDAGPDRVVVRGESTMIGGTPTATGNEPFSYTWSPTVGLNDPSAANPTATPMQTTTYTVEVTDVNGRKESDSVTVAVWGLIALNDVAQAEGADELVEFPDVTSGVGSLVGGLGDGFLETEALAVLHTGLPAASNGQVLSRIFAVDDDRLLEIDPLTGDGSPIGDIGFDDVDGIDFQPGTGVLFGITHGTNRLLTIDTTTGVGTEVADDVIVGRRLNDIAFHPDGRLFVITDGSPRIYQVDPATGAKLAKWELAGAQSMEGLLWHPLGTTLWSVADRDDGKDLVTVSLAAPQTQTGTVTFVGVSGFEDLEALALFRAETIAALFSSRQPTDTDPPALLPQRFALHQNRPNPFNPVTRIAFDLAQAGRVSLNVYDVAGRRVTTLVNRSLEAGSHSVVWRGVADDGRRASSGIYYYVVKMKDFTESRRMILLK